MRQVEGETDKEFEHPGGMKDSWLTMVSTAITDTAAKAAEVSGKRTPEAEAMPYLEALEIENGKLNNSFVEIVTAPVMRTKAAEPSSGVSRTR